MQQVPSGQFEISENDALTVQVKYGTIEKKKAVIDMLKEFPFEDDIIHL
jgi:hypothetical protein